MTNSRLSALADALEALVTFPGHVNFSACREAATILRSLSVAEPVAWRYREAGDYAAYGDGNWRLIEKPWEDELHSSRWEHQPLYTLPKEAEPGPSITVEPIDATEVQRLIDTGEAVDLRSVDFAERCSQCGRPRYDHPMRHKFTPKP